MFWGFGKSGYAACQLGYVWTTARGCSWSGRIDDRVAEPVLCQNLAFSALRYCVLTNQGPPIRTTTPVQTGPSIFPTSKYPRTITGISIIFQTNRNDHHHDPIEELGCYAATESNDVPHPVSPGDPTTPELPHPVTTRRSGSPAEPARLQGRGRQGDFVCLFPGYFHIFSRG